MVQVRGLAWRPGSAHTDCLRRRGLTRLAPPLWQIYQEPLCRRHHAALLSEATCFRALIFAIAVILSLVVAYNTGGFWLKTGTSIEQPTVHYTWDALLLLEVGALAA
jgi:hypothetical protein